MLVDTHDPVKQNKEMRLTPPKYPYCAYCGRRIMSLSLVMPDEDGRIFRYHRVCKRKAELRELDTFYATKQKEAEPR